MSEIPKPKYEMSPQGLRKRLDDICVDYLAYTCPGDFQDTTSLLLATPTGERIIIEKAMEGTQPEGHFFQDMAMSVYTSRTFDIQQTDFNFNQFGDGQLRKRVTSNKKNERIPGCASGEGILHLAQLSLDYALESYQNMQLAQEMGIDNQPVTPEEVAEAMSYLDGASVLDPETYQPVGVVQL